MSRTPPTRNGKTSSGVPHLLVNPLPDSFSLLPIDVLLHCSLYFTDSDARALGVCSKGIWKGLRKYKIKAMQFLRAITHRQIIGKQKSQYHMPQFRSEISPPAEWEFGLVTNVWVSEVEMVDDDILQQYRSIPSYVTKLTIGGDRAHYRSAFTPLTHDRLNIDAVEGMSSVVESVLQVMLKEIPPSIKEISVRNKWVRCPPLNTWKLHEGIEALMLPLFEPIQKDEESWDEFEKHDPPINPANFVGAHYPESLTTLGVRQLFFDFSFPPTLKHLRLLGNATTAAWPIVPRKVERISMDDEFIGPECMSPNLLQEGLRSLVFGAAFRGSLNVSTLPSTLTELDFAFFSKRSVHNALVGSSFPAGLLHLRLSASFNQNIDKWVLPRGLIEFRLGSGFQQKLPPVTSSFWPSTLRCFSVSIPISTVASSGAAAASSASSTHRSRTVAPPSTKILSTATTRESVEVLIKRYIQA